jgi:hypothetical protein
VDTPHDSPEFEDLTPEEEEHARTIIRVWLHLKDLQLPLLLAADLEELLVDFFACFPPGVAAVKASFSKSEEQLERHGFLVEELEYQTGRFLEMHGYARPKS